MPAILIQPDNRLLGWSMNDLTLYGGQPAPGVTIGRPGEVQSYPQLSSRLDAAAPEARDTAPGSAIESDPTAVNPEPAPANSAADIQPVHLTAAPVSGEGPYLSGASASAPMLFTPSHAASQPTGQAPHSADLTAPAPAESTLTAPLIQHAPVPGAGHIVHDTLPALEPLGAVTDTLDGIAGINPSAGIGTILDLMKTADVFELRATTTDLIDHGTAPILDTLASDISDGAPLLGDIVAHHDDGGLLGGLDTHHGLPGL
jgi:hypothetical protein